MRVNTQICHFHTFACRFLRVDTPRFHITRPTKFAIRQNLKYLDFYLPTSPFRSKTFFYQYFQIW
jgi:hypothetical protein